jgi:hypothetical protein
MNKNVVIFLILFTLSIFQKAPAQTKTSGGVTAVSAFDFLNSIGINTHMGHGEDVNGNITALNYAGFRNIRDGDNLSSKFINDMILVHNTTTSGIRIVLSRSGADDRHLTGVIEASKTLAAAGVLLAFDGPNEPNNWSVTYQGKKSYITKNESGKITGGDFSPVANFQKDLYARVKADPVLKDYPVFSVSDGGGASPNNVGLQYLTIPTPAPDGVLMPAGTVFADYANVHNYFCHPSVGKLIDNLVWHAADPVMDTVPGNGGHFDGIYGNFGKTWLSGFKGYTTDDLKNLPRVTTETGITSGKWGLTEQKRGAICLDLFLSQFKRGYKYTFIYNLRDIPGVYDYGMFTSDFTPKTAATYLRNLTTILNDTGSAEILGKLNYSIPDQPATVHDLLLQKSNGKFELVVWDERFTGGTETISVNLGRTYRKVKIYDPTIGTSAIQTLTNVSSVTLPMSDHPIIIDI